MSNIPPPATPSFIFAATSKDLPVGPAADTFQLSGENCPGLCELTSCAATQSWDVRSSQGFSWATVVPNGEKLSEPVFSVEIWEGEQYKAWVKYATKYFSRPAPPPPGTTGPTVKSKAFGFSHPLASAAPFCISSVLIQDVSYKGRGAGGSLLFEVKLLEWKQPQLVKGSRVDTTTPPTTNNGPPPAEDALGQQTNDMTAAVSGQLETLIR